MAKPRFADLLEREGPVVGTWSQIASADAVEIVATGGFDFTIIDTEHTAFGLERAQDLLRAADACGLAAAVRISAIGKSQMAKALDAGFQAVVVPGIRSADDVRHSLGWMHFGSNGERGACPCIRAGGQAIAAWTSFAEKSARDVLCVPLIETPEAVAEIDSIVSLEGIRCVMLGPFDLSVELGCGGKTSATPVVEAVGTVLRACRARSVVPILPLFDPSLESLKARMSEWSREGVSVFTLGTDKQLLATVARALLERG